MLSQILVLLGSVFADSVILEDSVWEGTGLADLSPFKECRMWSSFRLAQGLKEDDPWGPDSIELGQSFATSMIQSWGNASWDVEASSPVVFGSPPTIEKQGWLQTVPLAIHILEPLWNSQDWNSAQMALALSAQKFFAAEKNAPRLRFEEGNPEQNHEQLVVLGKWYREQMKDPENYARMLLSTDDGPWLGLEYSGKEIPEAKATREVGDALELRLCPTDDLSPWLLQCVRDGEVAWSKVITMVAPDQDLDFMENRAPVRLGCYGWMVLMRFGVPGDIEAVILYLDDQGELLFYFTSN